MTTPSLIIRKCTKLDEFHRCVELQKEIWGEADLEVEPYVTFVVAAQTGGQVLGAFDGGTMVGFTLSMVGIHGATPYLHSHMTGVLPGFRDRGIGRLLNLSQREDALSRGIRTVEWTFDPLETRNAHFNFNRLGAISRKLIPNFYGITTSPLHRGLPTDRLLVEWQLDTKRVVAAVNNLVGDPVESAATIHLPLPVAQGEPALQSPPSASEGPAPSLLGSGAPPSFLEGGSWVSPTTGNRDASLRTDTASLAEVQTRIREEFQKWFAKGYAATGVRFTTTGVDYCLVPWSDF